MVNFTHTHTHIHTHTLHCFVSMGIVIAVAHARKVKRNGSQLRMYSYSLPTQTIYIWLCTLVVTWAREGHTSTLVAGKDEDRAGRVGRPEKHFNLPYLALKTGLLTPPSGHVRKNKFKNKLDLLVATIMLMGSDREHWSIILIEVHHQC